MQRGSSSTRRQTEPRTAELLGSWGDPPQHLCCSSFQSSREYPKSLPCPGKISNPPPEGTGPRGNRAVASSGARAGRDGAVGSAGGCANSSTALRLPSQPRQSHGAHCSLPLSCHYQTAPYKDLSCISQEHPHPTAWPRWGSALPAAPATSKPSHQNDPKTTQGGQILSQSTSASQQS